MPDPAHACAPTRAPAQTRRPTWTWQAPGAHGLCGGCCGYTPHGTGDGCVYALEEDGPGQAWSLLHKGLPRVQLRGLRSYLFRAPPVNLAEGRFAATAWPADPCQAPCQGHTCPSTASRTATCCHA